MTSCARGCGHAGKEAGEAVQKRLDSSCEDGEAGFPLASSHYGSSRSGRRTSGWADEITLSLIGGFFNGCCREPHQNPADPELPRQLYNDFEAERRSHQILPIPPKPGFLFISYLPRYLWSFLKALIQRGGWVLLDCRKCNRRGQSIRIDFGQLSCNQFTM